MPAETPSRAFRTATYGLVLLSAVALEFARTASAGQPWVAWLATGGTIAGLLLISAWLERRRRTALAPTTARSVAGLTLVLLLAAPLVGELVLRRFWGLGESPELVQLVVLRNLMLGLTVLPLGAGGHRLATVLSLFLMLGTLIFCDSWPQYIVAGLYGIGGMWWLLGANWERMQGRFAAQAERELPLSVSTGAVSAVLGLAVLSWLALGGIGTTAALGGWFWGSGGTGSSDPFAGRGVRDGDQLVAARDEAASFGAVESELFLDSDMPSLYDMFNDMYGEPVTKKPETERSIGLAASPEPPKEQETAQTQQTGREFAAVRRRPNQRPTRLDDRQSDAILVVGGRVPLHLRLETFDRFDGRVWSQGGRSSEASPVTLSLPVDKGEPWVNVHHRSPGVALCAPEQHMLKVIRLATNRIPTPAHPLAALIDKVDQCDFYAWTDDDVLALPVRKQIPPLQVIHVRSRSFDPERLPGGLVASLAAEQSSQPADESDPIARLARQWTAGIAPGYPQIAAVADRLRAGPFVLDAAYTPPADCENVVAHFLLESQRGADYLFASSAAEILQRLGYRVRFVTGLYADPNRYERLSGQTPIKPDNVHCWVEASLDGTTWITVEPSPGYEVLPPYRTWQETLARAAAQVWSWARQHPLLGAALSLVVFCLVVWRREVADGFFTLLWHASRLASPRTHVLTTLWLIDRRAGLAGRRRPSHAPLGAWYRSLAALRVTADSLPAAAMGAPHLEAVLAAAARYLYAPPGAADGESQPAPELAHACREVAKALSLRRLQPTRSTTPFAAWLRTDHVASSR
jgi:protein-glutamine gamma-glutamyltransferase